MGSDETKTRIVHEPNGEKTHYHFVSPKESEVRKLTHEMTLGRKEDTIKRKIPEDSFENVCNHTY